MAKNAVNYTGLIPEVGDSFESATTNTTGSLEGIDTKIGIIDDNIADMNNDISNVDNTSDLTKVKVNTYADLNTTDKTIVGAINEHESDIVELNRKAKVYTYDTMAQAQADLSLVAGDIIEVLGYYTKGDGGGHKRIVSTTDDGSGVARGSLWLNYIVYNNTHFSKHLGLKNDTALDCSLILQKIFNLNFYNLVIEFGEYKLEDMVYIENKNNVNIINNGIFHLNSKALAKPTGIGIINCKDVNYSSGFFTEDTVRNNYIFNEHVIGLVGSITIMENCDNVLIENVEVEYAYTGILAIAINKESIGTWNPVFTGEKPKNIKLKNNKTTFCTGLGVALNNCSSSEIYENYVFRCGDGGIYAMTSDKCKIYGNKRISNYVGLISENENDQQAISIEACTNTKVFENYVLGFLATGIDVKRYCKNIDVYENIIEKCQVSSICARGGDMVYGSNTNIKIYRNTIIENGTEIISNFIPNDPTWVYAGAISSTRTKQIEIKDNTIINPKKYYAIKCQNDSDLYDFYNKEENKNLLSITSNTIKNIKEGESLIAGTDTYDVGFIYVKGYYDDIIVSSNNLYGSETGTFNGICCYIEPNAICDSIVIDKNLFKKIKTGILMRVITNKQHAIKNNSFVECEGINSGIVIAFSENALIENNIFFGDFPNLHLEGTNKNNIRNNLFTMDLTVFGTVSNIKILNNLTKNFTFSQVGYTNSKFLYNERI